MPSRHMKDGCLISRRPLTGCAQETRNPGCVSGFKAMCDQRPAESGLGQATYEVAEVDYALTGSGEATIRGPILGVCHH